METLTTLQDYIEILKRRKWSLCFPALFIFLLGAVIALSLPPIYKSTSTILIEQQEIPPDYVMSTVTSYAEQRLQTINQRIMSFERLKEIVDRFGLYSDLRDRLTAEQIVEKMRDTIDLDTISAEVVDQRTGRPTTATIAFTLSFEGKDPKVVQQVTGTLTSLYLEENLQVRKRQAKETTRFLETEMQAVKDHLADLEARIAAFKEQHMSELPELLQANMQSKERIENDIARLSDQLRMLKERRGYLQTQLAGLPQEEEEDTQKRLSELRVRLAHLKSNFSDEYPDVVNTRREIAELEKQLRQSNGGSSQAASKSSGSRSQHPAHVALASQLSSTREEIDSINRQIAALRLRAQEYTRRIEATPKVEETYNALQVERDNTQAKYNDLMSKYMEAKVAQGLEKEQKGERFTLIDPARYPENPVKPNRPAIILISLILGIGGGVGAASLREYLDRAVRTADGLTRATALPVLASVPELETPGSRARRALLRVVLFAGGVLVLAALIAAFHYLVMDLDILWSKIGRRLALFGP